MAKPITIIYPAFNRYEYTVMTLPKLLDDAHGSSDLIEELRIYDDNSEDGTSEFIQQVVEKVKDKTPFKINYIRKKIGNSTFQINDSYKKTDSKYLVKIDNDIFIPNKYFETLYGLMEKHDDIAFLMMPETANFPFINHPVNMSLVSRPHIGGVGIFRKSVFDKKGDIISDKQFFGFTKYQTDVKKEEGLRICTLKGSGNMLLDASPIYSRVRYYEKKGWGRNMWKGVKSILDKKNKMEYHGYMISEELYLYIRENLSEGSTILELGSGDGTKLLSDHYKMFSIENNEKWLNKYDSTYIYAPIINGWFDVDVLKRDLPTEYDLILVDAPPAFTEEARMGFYHNISLFNTSVPIIIDDTHRSGEKRLADNLSKYLGRDYREIKSSQKSFCIFD